MCIRDRKIKNVIISILQYVDKRNIIFIMVIATFFRNIVIIKKEYVKDSSYGTNGMASIYYRRDEMCEKT